MLRFASSLLTIALAIPAAAGVNRWSASGPPEQCDQYGRCTKVKALALDPLDENRIYAITLGSIIVNQSYAWLPRLWRSDDGGATWVRVGEGSLFEREDRRLVTIRVAKSSPRTIYVVAEDAVYRSTDAGESWGVSQLPDTFNTNRDIVVDATNANTVYVAQSAWCENAGCGGGIYRSDDGARTWRRVGLEHLMLNGISADPRDPATLYAYAGKIYQTRNRGGSWKEVTPPNAHRVTSVAVDPITPSTIYANASIQNVGCAMFKSTDGGKSWRTLRDENVENSFRLPFAIDPTHSLQLLATNGWGTPLHSVDGGESWSSLVEGLFGNSGADDLVIAPSGTTFHGVVDGRVFHYSIVPQRRRAARQ
ncbi:MAG TPA: hypothetical protein VMU84_20565 [Thermoanaerobaculia bacterium]|nr:hypothetical protein [Thermoanaerobaculia bacterium]